MEVLQRLTGQLTAEDVATVLEHDSQTDAVSRTSLADLEALSSFLASWARKDASEMLNAMADACGNGEVSPFETLLCLLCSSMLRGPKDAIAWQAALSYSTVLVLPGSTAFGASRTLHIDKINEPSHARRFVEPSCFSCAHAPASRMVGQLRRHKERWSRGGQGCGCE